MVDFKKLYWFHGHACPMSTIGFRAGSLARKMLKLKRSDHRNAAAAVYFRSCASDGIQIAFPATLGNGNLNVMDEKKMRFEFVDRRKNLMVKITFAEPLKKTMGAYLDMRKASGGVKGKKSEADLEKIYHDFMIFTQTAGDKELFVYSIENI